jgi:hypothetical protein
MILVCRFVLVPLYVGMQRDQHKAAHIFVYY